MKKNIDEQKNLGEKFRSIGKAISEGFLKFIRKPSGIFALFVVVLVLLNLVASRAFVRWDITSPKSYSLSNASKESVRTVDEPLNIKVFFSSNLSAPYSSTYQYLKDILSEYKSAGNENFSYEIFDMNKDENIKLATDYGVQQVQIREIKNNEVGFKNVFMGVVVSYADQTEVLNGLASSDGMEYRITNAINSVISGTNALVGLTDGIRVTLYQSSNMNDMEIAGLADVEPAVKNVIDRLNKKYENRLDLAVSNPSSSEVQSLAETYGIPSYKLETETNAFLYGTVAIVLENNDRSRVVPIEIAQGIDVSTMQIHNSIRGLDVLEESIDDALKALASNVTSVAYITGHGEMSINDEENGAAVLAGILAEHYVLKEVNLSEKNIPLDTSCVMINGPKSVFSQKELYKLDQFLMNGGNLLLFLDPFDPEAQQQPNGMPSYLPLDTGLDSLLSKYGITCNKEYVMDERCAQTQDRWTGKVVDIYYAPMLETDSLNQGHAITKNLGDVMFFLPGSIDVDGAEKISGEKVSVLATTSKRSWAEKENFILDSNYIMPPDRSEEKRSNVAVLVEGKFSSAFDKVPEAEEVSAEDEKKEEAGEELYKSDTHLAKSIQNGKVLVVSTSHICGPFLRESFFQGTGIFVENLVDYMSENEDLCTMRTKGLSLASLEVDSLPLANVVKYFNEIGLALLVALVGLFVLLMRKKRRAQIRLRYNPNDSREEPKKVLKVKSSIKNKKGDKNE